MAAIPSQTSHNPSSTATTIYLYCEDKGDLLFAVMDQAYDRYLVLPAPGMTSTARRKTHPLRSCWPRWTPTFSERCA
jgi:hypothetical protein